MDYVKIILTSYPSLDRLILALRESINLRCRKSFYFAESTEKLCSKIIEKKNTLDKLINLKRMLDILFSRLSEEEKDLIYLKYFEIEPKNNFAFTMRTYFRKQHKLLKKIEKYLSYLGIDEQSFRANFMGMTFFKLIEIKCELIKRKKGATKIESKFFNCR